MMRRRGWALALACLLVWSPLALAAGAGYAKHDDGLTRDAYSAYYEVCAALLEGDWDAPIADLLAEVAPEYDMDAEALYAFLRYAVDADPNHVWIPVHGGIRYHIHEDCSGMLEPRPTTIDDATARMFTPCGFCYPK